MDEKLDAVFENVIYQKKYATLTENSDKINYVLKLLKENNVLEAFDPKIMVHILRNPKDEIKATLFREVGNKFYRDRKFFDALESYNKCISYAKSESLGLGYGNRSAVYMELKMYKKCLENILLARQSHYPTRLVFKLNDREELCHKMLNANLQSAKNPENLQPKLSYPPSADNPAIANCIEIVVNKKFGRQFQVKQDLKVGDIVILDKPLYSYLNNNFNYQRCANCMIENNLSLIPCSGCTKTMFCSIECLITGQEKFHKYECHLIDNTLRKQHSHLYFSLRIVLSLMDEFGSAEVLDNMWKESYKDPMQVMPKSETTTESKKAFLRRELELYYSLTPMNKMELGEAAAIAMVFDWLLQYTDLKNILTQDKERSHFLNVWGRYSLIGQANSKETCVLTRDRMELIQNMPIAANICPVIGLFNHSCVANAMEIACGESLMGVMVVRPVKKGQQLFINYVDDYLCMPKAERQAELKSRYGVTCTCEGCRCNYPVMQNLSMGPDISGFNWDNNDRPYLHNYKEASRKFEECRKFLQKNDGKYPSSTLLLNRMAMQQAFATMYRNYSINVTM